MDRKGKYIEFCERHYMPLMLQPFWLDAVCGADNWQVCVSISENGEIVGSLVYHISKYRGFSIIKMPPLTDYSGLWINYPPNLKKNSSQYTFEKNVCNDLITQLPKVAFFYQQWHPEVRNWLPFFWKGFRQTSLYTYLLDLQDDRVLWDQLSQTIRKNIQKLERSFTVEITDDIDQLYELAELTFANKKTAPPYSKETLRRLDDALKKRNLRKIYLARDESGKYHAGVYVVRDDRCAYSIISVADPALRHSRAGYLVQWQSILDCLGKVKTYDLCGSILEPVEESLRSFGGLLTPHFKITKAQNKLFYILGVLLNKDV